MTRRQAGDLGLGVRQPEQGAGVALGDLGVADGVEDLFGQVKQPDQVRERRAIEPQPAGEFFLGSAVASRGTRGTRSPCRRR